MNPDAAHIIRFNSKDIGLVRAKFAAACELFDVPQFPDDPTLRRVRSFGKPELYVYAYCLETTADRDSTIWCSGPIQVAKLGRKLAHLGDDFEGDKVDPARQGRVIKWTIRVPHGPEID